MSAQALADAGSAGLLVSLWLPWYSFRIPGFAIDQADALAGQFGVLAPLIRQGQRSIPITRSRGRQRVRSLTGTLIGNGVLAAR